MSAGDWTGNCAEDTHGLRPQSAPACDSNPYENFAHEFNPGLGPISIVFSLGGERLFHEGWQVLCLCFTYDYAVVVLLLLLMCRCSLQIELQCVRVLCYSFM